jgi:hypothetical protein
MSYLAVTLSCHLSSSRLSDNPQWFVNNKPVVYSDPTVYAEGSGMKNHFATLQKPFRGEIWLRKTPSYDQPTDSDDPPATYTYVLPTIRPLRTWDEYELYRTEKTVVLPKLLYPNAERYVIDTTLTVAISSFKSTPITMQVGQCYWIETVYPAESARSALCEKENTTKLAELSDTEDNPNTASTMSSSLLYSSAIWIALLILF